MEQIIVKTNSAVYPVYFERDFSALEKSFRNAELNGRKICLVTDSNVNALFADEVLRSLRKVSDNIFCFNFPAGEEHKNLSTVEGLYDCLIQNHADRKTVIAALGGGVTGDLAGFAAATFMRGVPFFQIPTTLLSQVDSSIGGKVGVDRLMQKNVVGAFYQPRAVYINVKTLEGLPDVQFSSGMAEVVKHGLALDAAYFGYLSENREKIKSRDLDTLIEIIKQSCRLKAEVVVMDEKESGPREILNFGHTVGHAVESLKNFSMPHGQCVGAGISAALFISRERGQINENDMDAATELLRYFGIATGVTGLKAEDIYQAMLCDKKTKNGVINLILLEAVGKAYTDATVTKDEIFAALNYIFHVL